MSSSYIRSRIKTFMETEFPTETVIDLTAEYKNIQDMILENSLGLDDPWVGIQFLGFDEIPIDILSTNTQGKYREEGSITIHIVDIAKLGVHNLILTRAETIRDKFRGQRIDFIIIDSVSPANFGTGVTLSFEGGYTSASITINYRWDRIL